MRVVDLDQRTDGWLAWRQLGLGGSDAAVIAYGRHFDRTIADLYVEKTNPPAARKRRDTGAMARGRRLEGRALRGWEQLTGLAAAPLCCVHAEHDWLKASLDGWCDRVGGGGLVLEIKAPNKIDHGEALEDKVPHKYVPQVDHLMLVTGARVCHYVSYNDYFPELRRLAVVRVAWDEERGGALYAAEKDFWGRVQRREPDPAWTNWENAVA